MTLERWLALLLIAFFLAYGYTAFFLLDEALPPILRRNPVWPSTFPKIISVAGLLISLCVLIGLEKSGSDTGELDLKKWRSYKTGQALSLVGLMIGYALVLRTFGFLLATFLFLAIGSHILQEKRIWLLALISASASGGVWYIVDAVLGIYMNPFPDFLQ